MNIRLVNVNDAKLLAEYHKTNAGHFEAWEPRRVPGYHSASAWEQRLSDRVAEQEQGKAAYFIALSEGGDKVIAHCSLTNICYGAFQACHMGYGVAAAYEGKGVMFRLCSKVIEHAFTVMKLNRIMANYMHHNVRSASLLGRLGFQKEGEAKKYLKINGAWSDHVLTSLINPENK